MRFAAGIFSYAVEREPVLKEAAYILIFNIGIELLLAEIWHIEVSDWLRFAISIGTIVLALVYAHFKPLHVFRPVLIWIAQGFSRINAVVDWILAPVGAIFSLIGKLFKHPKNSPAE